MMSEGSTSAAPVTMPGPMRRSTPRQPFGCNSVTATGGLPLGQDSSFPRSAGVPLRDVREFTVQVAFNFPLMQQTQRLGVGDDSEGGNGGQQQDTADPEENP